MIKGLPLSTRKGEAARLWRAEQNYRGKESKFQNRREDESDESPGPQISYQPNPEKPREGWRGPEKEGVWCKIPHGGKRVGGRQEALAPAWVCSNLTSLDIAQQLGEVNRGKKPRCN
jgi:hypothetical protein